MPTTRGPISSGESVPVSKTDTALLSASQGCHQDLVTEHTGNRDKLQRPRQACQGECGLSPAEPPSQHSHPQLSAPLPGFEPTGKECLDGCASSDIRARTSRPAAEMLKGTSLLRKKKKEEMLLCLDLISTIVATISCPAEGYSEDKADVLNNWAER